MDEREPAAGGGGGVRVLSLLALLQMLPIRRSRAALGVLEREGAPSKRAPLG
jgi:hypothetical protein